MPDVSVQWVNGRQFVGTDDTGHSVVLSGSKDQGGVKPSQMLLVALASCTGVDVVEIMAKFNFPMQKFLNVTLLTLFILILSICLPTDHVNADVGPKPSMDFEFEYETEQPLQIVDGMLYECDQTDCSDAEPLEELGPQGFSCTTASCSSMAYGYSEYHRLLIRFSDDKDRQSNIFQSDSYNSTFRVVVRENDLVVEKIHGDSNPLGWTLLGLFLGGIFSILLGLILLILLVITIIRAGELKADFESSRWVFISLWLVMGVLLIVASIFSLAIPVTITVEAILGLVYAVIRNRSKLTTITMVILANMITVLPFWAVTSFISGDYHILFIIIAEILIWFVESVILYLTQRKTIRFWEAALLSLLLNGVSTLIGLFLPF